MAGMTDGDSNEDGESVDVTNDPELRLRRLESATCSLIHSAQS